MKRPRESRKQEKPRKRIRLTPHIEVTNKNARAVLRQFMFRNPHMLDRSMLQILTVMKNKGYDFKGCTNLRFFITEWWLTYQADDWFWSMYVARFLSPNEHEQHEDGPVSDADIDALLE